MEEAYDAKANEYEMKHETMSMKVWDMKYPPGVGQGTFAFACV